MLFFQTEINKILVHCFIFYRRSLFLISFSFHFVIFMLERYSLSSTLIFQYFIDDLFPFRKNHRFYRLFTVIFIPLLLNSKGTE